MGVTVARKRPDASKLCPLLGRTCLEDGCMMYSNEMKRLERVCVVFEALSALAKGDAR